MAGRRAPRRRLPHRRGAGARARSGRGPGAQHVDVGRPRPQAPPRRARPGRLLRAVRSAGADGRDHDHRRGGRVPRRRLRRGRRRLARLWLARLRRGRRRDADARRPRHVDPARHKPRACSAVPRPARRHGPDRLRGAVRRRGPAHRRDVVWVSAAAGAVGSLAAQFAKLRGHRVIGSAGSERRSPTCSTSWASTRPSTTARVPSPSCCERPPEGIDVYFDCVGGDHLEAALGALRRGGAPPCAEPSPSTGAPSGPANLFQATADDLTLRGAAAATTPDGRDAARRDAMARRGRLRYRETIVDGLERAPEALARMLAGDTIGKTLVRISG